MGQLKNIKLIIKLDGFYRQYLLSPRNHQSPNLSRSRTSKYRRALLKRGTGSHNIINQQNFFVLYALFAYKSPSHIRLSLFTSQISLGSCVFAPN